MTIDAIQSICKKMPGVTEDIKWENHLCFNIGGKMFLITAPDEFPVSASIKVSEESFLKLTDTEGIIPAPYLARHHWVKLQDISIWTEKQWEFYASQAYQLVLKKLPAKRRQDILGIKKTEAAGTEKKGKRNSKS